MRCPACGSEDVVDYHGHESCVCGRIVEECCQGAPARCETPEAPEVRTQPSPNGPPSP